MRKSALIVCPSYRFTGDDDDKKTQTLLARLNLLPSELREYNMEADIHRLRSLLQSHCFTCVVLSGQVDACTVGAAFEKILTTSDTAVLAFCGHGSAEDSSHRGAMLLSDNVRLSSAWVNSHLAGFSGTFIMLLNMCLAAGYPPSGAGDTFGVWGQEPVNSDCKTICIMASSATEKACGNASGSPFVQAIVGILSGSDGVTYHSFGQRLAAARSDRGVKSEWIYQNTYTGRFFGPAIVRDHVRPMGLKPQVDEEDVISTSNLVWNYA